MASPPPSLPLMGRPGWGGATRAGHEWLYSPKPPYFAFLIPYAKNCEFSPFTGYPVTFAAETTICG